MPTPIIFDCDTGHDDALELLLAARAPELKLLAVICEAGNQTLEKTALNTRRVMTVGRIHGVPVAAGMMLRQRPVTPHNTPVRQVFRQCLDHRYDLLGEVRLIRVLPSAAQPSRLPRSVPPPPTRTTTLGHTHFTLHRAA